MKANRLLPHSPQNLRVRGVPESVDLSMWDFRSEGLERIVKPYCCFLFSCHIYYFCCVVLCWFVLDSTSSMVEWEPARYNPHIGMLGFSRYSWGVILSDDR